MGLLEQLVTPLGKALKNKRPGTKSSYQHRTELQAIGTIELNSDSFPNGVAIPDKHAGKGRGENLSPEFHWSKLPESTKQLMFVMEDIDVPFEKPILHFLAFFSLDVKDLPEGALTSDNSTITFISDRKKRKQYNGPRALPGHGTHRYLFHLYALDKEIGITDKHNNIETILPEVNEHVLASGHYAGTQIG
ncbi:MAG: YbhB/YbcL family Raf kinase inhibitor-like protein [Micrococcaceae bacterium]